MALHLVVAAAAALAMRYKSGMPARSEEAMATGRAKTPVLVAAHPDTMEMRPAPIKPDWILAGNPVARVASHSDAADGCATTGIWDCTAGTFRWYFGWDETVVIVDGTVHVTAEDGSERVLSAGDVAYFKGGTWATWRIDTYLRKVAFLRQPMPAPVAALYRLKGRLRASIKRVIT